VIAIALDGGGRKVTHYIIPPPAPVGAGKPEQPVVCKVAQLKIISNLCARNYGIYSSMLFVNATKGDHMTRIRPRLTALFVSGVIALTLSSATARSAAQETHQPQTAGVDNTKMGPYRALARLTYAAAHKCDGARAAQLAKILERVWDKAEDYGGDTALSKTNPDLFKQADKAMDDFMTAVQAGAKTPAEAAKLKVAYNTYLEKLQLAD
jgi:hypothetical protein